MNGFSEVHLTSHGLEAGVLGNAVIAHKSGSAAQFNRWQMLWLRYRTRRQLLTLDAEQRRDIGLSRAQALQEGLKPCWRV